jgi:glucose-1-phosphate adenylyltransferase
LGRGQLAVLPHGLRRPAASQGSMGIYVFNRQVLIDALVNDHDDFGKHIIPASLQKYKVFAISSRSTGKILGRCERFLKPTWLLNDPVPAFNFFDHIHPIYTQQRDLPASTCFLFVRGCNSKYF